MKQFLVLAGAAGVAAVEDKVILNAGMMRAHIKEVVETMPHDQAMQSVTKKAPAKLLTALQVKKMKKETAQEAVKTLNNMYLEAEEELDEKMFECVAERQNYKDRIDGITKEINLLATAEEGAGNKVTDAQTDQKRAAEAENKARDDIMNLTKAYEEQLRIDEAKRDELKLQYDAMSFILEIAQCKAGAKLMLSQGMDESRYQVCARQNAENDQYLLNLFSNPEVAAKVDEELNGEQHAKLQQILGFKPVRALQRADEDMESDEDVTSSFLQKAARNDDDSWKSCDGVEPDCAIMTEKVGGMYGDARDAYDRHMAMMSDRSAEFKAEKGDLATTVESMVTEKDMAGEEIGMYNGEKAIAKGAKDHATSRLRDEHKELKKLWSACKVDIKKIMYDGVCSVLNVRKNVVDAAKKALNVNPDSLAASSDCSVTEWARDGNCSKECVARKRMPPSAVWDSLLKEHEQKWKRSPITSCDEGDPKNKDNCEVALPCPNTMERDSQCNKFLCPVDCELSRFSGWSTCSKDCDGGIMTKARKVVTRPQFGGEMCDVLTETAKCGESPCDVDCRLRRLRSSEWRKIGCVRGCKIRRARDDPHYAGARRRPMKYSYRRVTRKAVGRGKCAKKWSAGRAQARSCRERGRNYLMKTCKGDELCAAKMDVVFAFDSSGGVGENGHETIKSLVKEVATNHLPQWFGRPANSVGLVQFGNGKLIKKTSNGKKITVVQPAKQLTNGPTNSRRGWLPALEGAKWQKGFTNIAQALLVSCGMLQRRGRGPAFMKKVIIFTGSAPTLEFASQQAATQQCKDKGIQVDFVIIDDKYTPQNTAWEVVRGGTERIDNFEALPSYPPQAHIHHINGMDELVMKPKMFAKKLIPMICPYAQSPRRYRNKAKKGGYIMVTRGKDCGNWWKLVGRFRSPKQCASRIKRRNMKGEGGKKIIQFVFQGSSALRNRGVYPCYTHKKHGTVKPFSKKNKFPNPIDSDSSCTCTSLYCTGKVKGGKPGWSNQRQIMAKNSGAFSRYAIKMPKLRRHVTRKLVSGPRRCRRFLWFRVFCYTPKRWVYKVVWKLLQDGRRVAVTRRMPADGELELPMSSKDDAPAPVGAEKAAVDKASADEEEQPYNAVMLKNTGMTAAQLDKESEEMMDELADADQEQGMATDTAEAYEALDDVHFRMSQEGIETVI